MPNPEGTRLNSFLHSVRFPLLSEDGVVYSICTQSVDVSDHKRAEDQLRLMLRDDYLHPNGQIPAYEWNFGDGSPAVTTPDTGE